MEEDLERGDIVKSILFSGIGEIQEVWRDFLGGAIYCNVSLIDEARKKMVAGYVKQRVCAEKLELIKKGEPLAVSVIDLARNSYWDSARLCCKNKKISFKNISLHDLTEIFNKLVIPAIDVVRKADRESGVAR